VLGMWVGAGVRDTGMCVCADEVVARDRICICGQGALIWGIVQAGRNIGQGKRCCGGAKQAAE